MGEFIFNRGRSKTAHSYPENRTAGALTAFARNYALGPQSDTPVAIADTGTQIPWSAVDVPASSPTDVPITPKSTGFILITGMITVANSDTAPADLQIQVQVDGITQPFPEFAKVQVPPVNSTDDENGFSLIPFQIELQMVVGITRNIEILLTSVRNGVLVLPNNSSTLEIQEVSVATG